MPRYHLKDDGNPAICTAELGACPKGGDHFGTEAEARLGFEAAMAFDAWAPTAYSSLADANLFSGLASGLPPVEAMEQARIDALAAARAGLDRPAVVGEFKNKLGAATEALRSEDARMVEEVAALEHHRLQQVEKLSTWELAGDELREQELVVKDLTKELATLARERLEIARAKSAVERIMNLNEGAVPPGMHQCPACGSIISKESTTCGSSECLNDMEHIMRLEDEQWRQENASWYRD